MSDDRCRHDMLAGTCVDCRAPRATSRPDVFVRILPRPIYHQPDCDEVTWDEAEAERPGERVRLSREQVQRLLDAGVLERGGYFCHADARR